MMSGKITTWVLAILFTLNIVAGSKVKANLGKDRILSIPLTHYSSKVDALLKFHDADAYGRSDTSVDLRVSLGAVEELRGLGDVEFTDTTDSWIEYFEKNLKNPNTFCDDTNHLNCASRSADDFYSNYQDYDAIVSRIEGLVSASVSVEVEMNVLGQSYENRTMYVVEIGDLSKPRSFIFCNIHAREWLTPMFCSYLIETLLSGEGHALLEEFSFAVVPSANPDGYMYSRTENNLWRKTRKPNENSRCIGTDGNRNWDNNHCGVGSSTNPCSETYCGAFPFDNPEVANLNRYSLEHSNEIVAMLDIHSYGSYMLHPYGYTDVLPAEKDYVRMRECAQEGTEAATSISGDPWAFGTTPQVLGYSSGGTSKDYFYGNLSIIYPYTVEVRGNSFQPDSSNIAINNAEVFGLVEGVMLCIKKIEIDGIEATKPPTVSPTLSPTTPATAAPTTTSPITQAPTTLSPTSPPPTTAPTTKAPTAAPPTFAPTTKAPTTAPPTVAPTTKSPATDAPTSVSSDSGNSSSDDESGLIAGLVVLIWLALMLGGILFLQLHSKRNVPAIPGIQLPKSETGEKQKSQYPTQTGNPMFDHKVEL